MNPKFFSIACEETATPEVLIAALPGKRIRVLNLVCSCAADNSITFSTDAMALAVIHLKAFTTVATGHAPVQPSGFGQFETGPGEALKMMVSSNAETFRGYGSYVEV